MTTDLLIFKGLLAEMQEWSEDYSKVLFRRKVIRVYLKCLTTKRLLLATKIAEKYRKELATELRSDLSVAANYALFTSNLFKNIHRQQ